MSIEPSAVARVVGINTEFKDLRAGQVVFLPQAIAIIGQGNTASAGYPLTATRLTGGAAQAAAVFGFGSPIHHAALGLYPQDGSGVGSIPVVVLPLEEDDDAVAAVGSITPSGAATVAAQYWVRAAGILSAPVTLAAGDNVATICDKLVAAIDAVLEQPIDAVDGTTDVDITVKWAGASGNDVTVEVLDATGLAPSSGLTFTIVQPTGGLTDPGVAPALALIGTDWVTLIVNALGPTNTTALGLIQTKGDSRWGQLVRKPFVSVVGNPEANVGTATTVPAARPTDKVNVQAPAPGSVHMPVQIAAAFVREIAKVANSNPPVDYGARSLVGLLPGPDGSQWDYEQRDLAVKAGSSTVEVKDGVVRIGDVVTMYHPAGEVPPAYRYVVDIMKLMTVIYNIDLEFSKPEWAGAPLVPDNQAVVNPAARKPKTAKAALCAILDSLGLQAIIADPAFSKKNTIATIGGPKRLDVQTTIKLSSNSNIISVDLFFGFFFGS